MRILIFLLLLGFLSCSDKKLELSRVPNAIQTEIIDYSTIYIFYDNDTHQAVLNRNNLITSTHWVFHIDRRLSLYEAGKKIVQMQERKENPMSPHSNPDSKNFFSVTSEGKLKFVEFTKTRFRMASEEVASEKWLTQPDLSDKIDEMKANNNTPDKLYLSDNLNFEQVLLFLQEIQSEGFFIKEIFIRPKNI